VTVSQATLNLLVSHSSINVNHMYATMALHRTVSFLVAILLVIILQFSKGESNLPVVLNTWPFTEASDKGRGKN